MATIVKNIKKNEYPIPQDTIELCKKIGVLKHLPTTTPKDLTFELHNTTTEMANALRRCINSELEVLIMDFDDKDIESDDSFIITHELRKRINYIPIRQISGLTFSVNVKNNTDEIIPVYSRSIKEKKNKDDEKMFSETFILSYLRPGKHLIINNINIISGVAYKNNASFSFPGKVGYKCLDILGEDKIGPGGEIIKPSSMIIDSTKYRLSVHRQKYIDPVHIVKMALKTLNNKLDKIYKIVKETQENFYSPEMEINYLNGKANFKLFDETYTIGNLISKYGFYQDGTLTNIHCIKLHPSFNYVNIEIHHEDPRAIIMMSIEKIKKELSSIRSAF